MSTHGFALAGHGQAVEKAEQEGVELQDRKSRDAGPRTKEIWATVGDVNTEASPEVQDDENLRATQSTYQDAQAMKRMGKDQQLIRQFRLLSISSFVAIATATWEIGLFTIGQSLVDGGRPSLLYGTIWNFICFAPVWVSMAEMASMAPIAGAQYHWVSEWVPLNSRRSRVKR